MATQKDLEYYLAQVRRIAEHREVGVEKEIRKEYRTLLKDLQHFIGDEYARLAENDQLTYAILQQKSDYARFLEEVEGIINTNSPNISQKVQNLVQEMYALSYQGMITAVDRASDSEELKEALKGVRGVTPEIVKRAVENPVAGLTLNDILEKKRKEVIYEIKQQIGIGLTNGDRYSTMAKRIAERVDMDYRKAMTIVRTESHRVQEAGYHDSATELNKTLDAGTTTKRLQKTWRTMRDERVRKTSKANHRKLDGVSIPIDEKFDLGHGVKAEAPSQSGDPHNDINCRCYLSYDLVEVKKNIKAANYEFEYDVSGKKDVENHIAQMSPENRTQWERNISRTKYRIVSEDENGENYNSNTDTVTLFENSSADTVFHETSHAIDDTAVELEYVSSRREKRFGEWRDPKQTTFKINGASSAAQELYYIDRDKSYETDMSALYDWIGVPHTGASADVGSEQVFESLKKAIRSFESKYGKTASENLSDMIDATTRGQFPLYFLFCGHGKEYWEVSPKKEFSEAWAEHSSMKAMGMNEALEEIAKILPAKYKAINSVYEVFYNGKPYESIINSESDRRISEQIWRIKRSPV